MKLIPREQWICDKCGKVILKAEDGWLEWLNEEVGEKYLAHRFRIVHHVSASPRNPNRPNVQKLVGQSCYDEVNATPGHHLHHVISPDGLPILLGLIDRGSTVEPDYSGPHVKSLREWAELLRRLALPYYEEARLYWRIAARAGWFDGLNEFAIYSPDFLKRMVEEFGEPDGASEPGSADFGR